MSRQIFNNRLHAWYTDKPLRRHITVNDLAVLQLDDPAIPWTHETLGLPGRHDIPEQGVIYGEILCTVVELVLACAKTAYAATGKYTFLENLYIFNQALQRSSTGEPGQTGANDGD